jgi:hypothetical protein
VNKTTQFQLLDLTKKPKTVSHILRDNLSKAASNARKELDSCTAEHGGYFHILL